MRHTVHGGVFRIFNEAMMSEVYQLWTIQMSKAKKIEDKEIHLLDVTAKLGIPEFAPHMSDVMLYKSGNLSKEQYTGIYLRKMRDSRTNHPAVWKTLLKHHKVAVVCFCTAGEFCHRHLFVKDHKRYLESKGYKVELMGELLGPNYTEPAQLCEAPEIGSDVIPPKVVIPFSKESVLATRYPAAFTVKGKTFSNVTQFVMYCKAMLFGDKAIAENILATSDVPACVELGRQVQGFDDLIWHEKRKGYVSRGNYQKTLEHNDIKEFLLNTGNNILVKAGTDPVWGAGLKISDPKLYNRDTWQGLNLEGDIWMEIRKHFQESVIF
jgi:ribA/ribD-fused uncharacterized protein